ncbi:hypothetical protein EXIGLDRAFT_807423 [Exidia glandulosa HHB12029]|uniref:Amino acid transporter transmembrane domain-containing protein n=1 Tax=Exidia glandulosa HHB12029 TaxID=1314781 RepID=A0A165M090_EXIGL|nr:hypothetical protein EXIGLDRAFT_807423 [Exidia glandulosa HHB12029]
MMSSAETSTRDLEPGQEKGNAGRDIEPAAALIVGGQLVDESGNPIQYRTCSWQKTAALLFSQYICLAILSFPWSFSVLGMVPGVLVTGAVAASVQYTSLVLWRFCLAHPHVRDASDIGATLFAEIFGEKWRRTAYNATSVSYVLYNTFIQGVHCLVMAKLLNTLSDGALCTVAFTAIAACIMFIVSLPRPLAHLSSLGTFSVVMMSVTVLLAVVFSAVQGTPRAYDPVTLGEPRVHILSPPGTNFVSGMAAFLNIKYTFVGQTTLPSFIAEMKEPKDFPKALWAVTIAEVIMYTLCGAVMYHFIGEQYMTAPAFGSLRSPYLKIAFAVAIPTVSYVGALYASISARFILFRLFAPSSRHRTHNTLLGWGIWVGLLITTWLAAFVLAEAIPFFSDMLALIGALFGGWFGFIFWAMAYLALNPTRTQRWGTPWRTFETLVNYTLIGLGVFTLVAGTYVSVQSIIVNSRSGQGSFSCASTGF